MTEPTLAVDVWSDVVCPWCRIGRAHLEDALTRFPHADRVQVTYRSFELEPDAPTERTESVVEHLARRYGTDPAQVSGMVDTVTARGVEAGIDFRFDIARSGNTFDAHRLLHLALERGQQAQVVSALMDAYFTQGRPIGDPETLEDVAVEAGLDRDEVRDVLGTDRYADRVRADEAMARDLQIGGVPFFVFGGRLAASGAQPSDVLLRALEQAWDAGYFSV